MIDVLSSTQFSGPRPGMDLTSSVIGMALSFDEAHGLASLGAADQLTVRAALSPNAAPVAGGDLPATVMAESIELRRRIQVP